MKFNYVLSISILIITVILQSCASDQPIEVEVPTSYSFSRDGSETVSYTGQTQRLNMLTELVDYCKSGADQEVDVDKLQNMFYNNNNPFSRAELNQTGDGRKYIANKLFGQGDGLTLNDGGKTENYFVNLLTEISTASKNHTQLAKNGEAGYIESGTSKYLIDANGFEPVQIFEKGLMGALMFHQAANVYLGSEKLAANAQQLSSEKNYTDLEHHIDEAYGYLELPTNMANFNTMGQNRELRYWAKYTYERTGIIGFDLATELHESFRNIRACAAAQFDYAEDEINCSFGNDIEAIKTNWELMMAANVIHYLNSTKENLTDQAKISHALSEGIGFLRSLAYANNGEGRLNENEILAIEAEIGANLWEIVPANLDKAKDLLVSKFPELANVKDEL